MAHVTEDRVLSFQHVRKVLLCFAEARVLRIGWEGNIHAQNLHSVPELGFWERVVSREDEARLVDAGGCPIAPVVSDRAPPLNLLFLRVDDGVREARVPLADAAHLLDTDIVRIHTGDDGVVGDESQDVFCELVLSRVTSLIPISRNINFPYSPSIFQLGSARLSRGVL